MPALYEITIEPGTNLMRIVLGGFFAEPMLSSYGADRGEAARRMVVGPELQVTLVDVSACGIQSQEAFEKFRCMLVQSGRKGARTAFVVGGSLARLQVRRMIAGQHDMAAFNDVAEAEAWLRASPAYRHDVNQPGCRFPTLPISEPNRRASSGDRHGSALA